MGEIDSRLEELGLVLPSPIKLPPSVTLGFPWVRVRGDRAFVSGHGPLEPDGSIAQPLGKVGRDVTPEQAYDAARLTVLAMLSSLKATLGELDRIDGWLRVFGMVNGAADFDRYPSVINGFSDAIVAIFGEARGKHARSAIGVAGLPFNLPVEIEAEVAITP